MSASQNRKKIAAANAKAQLKWYLCRQINEGKLIHYKDWSQGLGNLSIVHRSFSI